MKGNLTLSALITICSDFWHVIRTARSMTNHTFLPQIMKVRVHQIKNKPIKISPCKENIERVCRFIDTSTHYKRDRLKLRPIDVIL